MWHHPPAAHHRKKIGLPCEGGLNLAMTGIWKDSCSGKVILAFRILVSNDTSRLMNDYKWGSAVAITTTRIAYWTATVTRAAAPSSPALESWRCFPSRWASISSSARSHSSSSSITSIILFSSLGSLDEKWMAELASSMSAGMTEDKRPLGLGKPLIVWPSVEDVRCSIEGYASGNAIPSPIKNVEKEFLRKYWARWNAGHTGRCRAMPHIKSFARYSGQNLAWLLLTSSNLSKAAWGALQKNNSQLMIRSYELGVLFLPYTRKYECSFSCTDDGRLSKDQLASGGSSEVKQTKLVTLAWQGDQNKEYEVIQLPVPYELPPRPYLSGDVPWSWDRRYTEKDVYGQVWPRQVKLYSCQDS